MIGETTNRVDLRLDGDVTGPESARLQLRFEGGGANAQPLIFEQEGQETYLLKEGERIKIDSATGGALPTTDMMTYLAAAENVVVLDSAEIEFNTIVDAGTAGIRAVNSGTWAKAQNNILSGNTLGLHAASNGQIFSDFNLLL